MTTRPTYSPTISPFPASRDVSDKEPTADSGSSSIEMANRSSAAADPIQGHRARLRREATHHRMLQQTLANDGVSLAERIEALALPWLDAVFHAETLPEAVLNPDHLAAEASTCLKGRIDGVDEQLLRSECGLLEAIQHQVAILRQSPPRARQELHRTRRGDRWSNLLKLLEAWEITLQTDRRR